LTPDQERWAEALAIERWKGAMAELYIEERIASLSLAGDAAGVERFVQIAMRLAQLRQGERQ
jgi:hypothetical protein